MIGFLFFLVSLLILVMIARWVLGVLREAKEEAAAKHRALTLERYLDPKALPEDLMDAAFPIYTEKEVLLTLPGHMRDAIRPLIEAQRKRRQENQKYIAEFEDCEIMAWGQPKPVRKDSSVARDINRLRYVFPYGGEVRSLSDPRLCDYLHGTDRSNREAS